MSEKETPKTISVFATEGYSSYIVREAIELNIADYHESLASIELLLQELTALWTGGPAGGGGVRVSKRQRLSNLACLIPREKIPATIHFI